MRSLALIAALAWFANTAAASPLEDGIAAYNRGDSKAALELWQPLADAGNSDAQFNIGVLYANGEGVAQSYEQAIAWYRKAADQGDVYALNNLGLMYAQGQGVARDDTLAVEFYLKAAEKNFGHAQYNVAPLFAQGRGTAKDKAEAYKWLTLAILAYDRSEEDERIDSRNMRARLVKDMTATEIAEGERRAQEWSQKWKASAAKKAPK